MVRRRRFYTSYTLTHTRTHVQLRLYVYSYMPIASESFGNGWYSVGESRVRFVYTQVHMHIHTMYNIWAFCMRERCRTYIYMNRTRLLFTHSYAFAYEYIYIYLYRSWMKDKECREICEWAHRTVNATHRHSIFKYTHTCYSKRTNERTAHFSLRLLFQSFFG